MSAYELDDDMVRACLRNAGTSLPSYLAEQLHKQLPVPEPDREYLLKDKDGDLWRWSVRQEAWECATDSSVPLSWTTLQRTLAPLKVYGEIS